MMLITTAGSAFEELLALPETREAAAALDLKEGTYAGGLMVVPDSGRIQPPKIPIAINVPLRDVSLPDALNAIAQGYGHTMWLYEQRLAKDRSRTRLASRKLGSGIFSATPP